MSKFVLCLSLMMAAFVGGCSNTFNGAGKDIENMGTWVQDRT